MGIGLLQLAHLFVILLTAVLGVVLLFGLLGLVVFVAVRAGNASQDSHRQPTHDE